MAFVYRLKMIALSAVVALTMGCAEKEDPNAPPEPMGNFVLGHTVVVTKNAQIGPLSRRADLGVWKNLLISEVDKRLGRYEGDEIYHLGVHIDAYVLALPGVPMVAVPKSVLVISLSVFDNKTRKMVTEKPRQFNVFERSRKSTFIVGSGIVNSKTEQMENLSRNAAKVIHKYLLENKVWFGAVEDDEATTETTTQ